MRTIDYREELRHLLDAPADTGTLVEVSPMNFLMINGAGPTETGDNFPHSLEALLLTSFVIKHSVKNSDLQIDYQGLPPECLWWTHENGVFMRADKDDWKWTVMMMQPDCVTKEIFELAVNEIAKTKNPPLLKRVRFDSYFEGLSAQIMHRGSMATIEESTLKLHEFIRERGLVINGKHHELYLSDARSADPSELQTILRQPVTRV